MLLTALLRTDRSTSVLSTQYAIHQNTDGGILNLGNASLCVMNSIKIKRKSSNSTYIFFCRGYLFNLHSLRPSDFGRFHYFRMSILHIVHYTDNVFNNCLVLVLHELLLQLSCKDNFVILDHTKKNRLYHMLDV